MTRGSVVLKLFWMYSFSATVAFANVNRITGITQYLRTKRNEPNV